MSDIAKVLKLKDTDISVRFEGPIAILEDSNVSTRIHRSRLPGVIALLEAARDELLNERATARGRA